MHCASHATMPKYARALGALTEMAEKLSALLGAEALPLAGAAWNSTRHGIPSGHGIRRSMVSPTAWFPALHIIFFVPTRRGLIHGIVSHAALAAATFEALAETHTIAGKTIWCGFAAARTGRIVSCRIVRSASGLSALRSVSCVSGRRTADCARSGCMRAPRCALPRRTFAVRSGLRRRAGRKVS